ncbi:MULTISPECIES: DUF1775 domain-containing protein [unclassified Streptomyces]|uniref:DUF1775 domain-containing protein n=1 Tax=unclassified Streptomyces TaxID=2593676 RepID=UPI00081F6990|nr:DUF1775 domain-containing protein [Streptomyces sp. ScaeMP-e83]SCE17723.1 Uncharacterized protein YcnI [Streptomyces sp. ScaeMP-e83]
MSTSIRPRTVRRSVGVVAAATAAILVLAAPASAHVEVASEGAQALAENVTLNFDAATESDSAGITKLEVFLPKGIAPADVTYGEGPTGWKLAPTEKGFTVSGPAVAVGKDVTYSVVVRQLPDAKSLVFKTLQTYDDGRVDRWIELEESSGGGHGHSAPVLELKEAAPGAQPVDPTPTAPPSPSAPPTTEPADAKPTASDRPMVRAEEDGDSSPALPIGIAVAVLALAGGGLWWFLKRRRGGTA